MSWMIEVSGHPASQEQTLHQFPPTTPQSIQVEFDRFKTD
jgi:hypothetical protein